MGRKTGSTVLSKEQIIRNLDKLSRKWRRQPTRRETREAAHRTLRQHEQDFHDSRNPIYVFRSFFVAIAAGVPMPGFVVAFLDRRFRSVLNLTANPPRRDQIAPAFARAMGFTGPGAKNWFVDFNRPTHELCVAADVYFAHNYNRNRQRRGLEGTADWTSIFRSVAAAHRCEGCPSKKLGWQTVRRIWYARALDVIPPSVIAESKSKKLDDILR